jgi:hypothetical protein
MSSAEIAYYAEETRGYKMRAVKSREWRGNDPLLFVEPDVGARFISPSICIGVKARFVNLFSNYQNAERWYPLWIGKMAYGANGWQRR